MFRMMKDLVSLARYLFSLKRMTMSVQTMTKNKETATLLRSSSRFGTLMKNSHHSIDSSVESLVRLKYKMREPIVILFLSETES